ncbi:MAG: ROK family protein, partial [Oscillospiraceae bacterium]
LVLRQIATTRGISRVDISALSGLTKTTISNVVQTLINQGVVEEAALAAGESAPAALSGRPPIQLRIARTAPLVCGMLLKREQTVVLLGTLDGEIVEEISENFKNTIDPESLVAFLKRAYKEIRARHPQKILGVGISSVGIIDSVKGILLNPPNYFSYPCELPLVDLLKEEIRAPIFLMHDTGASILAEQLYSPNNLPKDFAYLTFQTGIGAGFVLNEQVYNGLIGQSGELGHCSINHEGEKCVCGNRGCLELYANVHNMRQQLEQYRSICPRHPLLNVQKPCFGDFVAMAQKGDGVCTSILMDFFKYVAAALVNIVNVLDIDLVVIEYEGANGTPVLEKLLEDMLNSRILARKYKHVTIRQSHFGSRLSRVSTIAIVTQHVFNGNLKLPALRTTA